MRTRALLLACALARNVPPLLVAERQNECKISATADVRSDINTAHRLPPKDLSNGQVRLPQSFTDAPNRPRPQRKGLNFCVAGAAFAALPCQDEKRSAGGVSTKVAPFVGFSHIIPILWTVLSNDRSRRDGLPSTFFFAAHFSFDCARERSGVCTRIHLDLNRLALRSWTRNDSSTSCASRFRSNFFFQG
jgi:hypothetical protein